MAKNAEERFGDVLFYGVILLLVYFVFRIFEPFLVPLGWAAVFGVIFYSVTKNSNENGAQLFGWREHVRSSIDPGRADTSGYGLFVREESTPRAACRPR